jgi:hypothetical protein
MRKHSTKPDRGIADPYRKKNKTKQNEKKKKKTKPLTPERI